MNTQTIVLGGGCFWCTEAVFQKLRGVISVRPGYAGGTVEHPTYEQVCTGTTGHVEVIRIEYDPIAITLDDLLSVFFSVHDPTTKDRQGADVGSQYRSVIFTTTKEQEREVRTFIQDVAASGVYSSPIVTEIGPLGEYYEAEEHHHNYFNRNPDKVYCQAVINPKLKEFRKRYTSLVKE